MSNEENKINTQDNWKHRSSKMLCRTCMFFVRKQKNHNNDSPGFGRCRKNAPTMEGFPAVFANDWCGKHKIDENKI